MRPGYSRDRLLNGIDDLNCLVENIGFEPICSLLAKQVTTPSSPIPHYRNTLTGVEPATKPIDSAMYPSYLRGRRIYVFL